MIRNIAIALCCLAGLQNASLAVVRLGEARYLTDADWAGIRGALGSSRVVWVIRVSSSSQLPPLRWHANAYLSATEVRGDLRRGPLVDLEGLDEGRGRVWRDLDLRAGWAQLAVPPDGLQDAFVESDRARPFIVRGEFTDAELRAIVTAIRGWRPVDHAREPTNLGPLVGVSRTAPMAVEAQLDNHLFATLEFRKGEWVVVSTRIVIA